MNKSIKFASFLLILSTLFSEHVLSFGQIGHRITGEIAEGYLTDETRKKIIDLLPDESLAEVSTYADEMRSNPEEFWQKTANPYHYATVEHGHEYDIKKAPVQGDIITAIKKYSSILIDDKSSIKEKRLALKLIVHFIGDLHQPLHVGNGTDRGGNDFDVVFFGKKTNLHRVWDSQLIDNQKLSYTEWTDWLTKKISAEEVKQWQSSELLVWLKESQTMRDEIYPKSNKISWNYQYQNLPKVKQRLSQAGVRIASYLNSLFDEAVQ